MFSSKLKETTPSSALNAQFNNKSESVPLHHHQQPQHPQQQHFQVLENATSSERLNINAVNNEFYQNNANGKQPQGNEDRKPFVNTRNPHSYNKRGGRGRGNRRDMQYQMQPSQQQHNFNVINDTMIPPQPIVDTRARVEGNENVMNVEPHYQQYYVHYAPYYPAIPNTFANPAAPLNPANAQSLTGQPLFAIPPQFQLYHYGARYPILYPVPHNQHIPHHNVINESEHGCGDFPIAEPHQMEHGFIMQPCDSMPAFEAKNEENLINQNITPDMLEFQSYTDEDPVDTNNHDERLSFEAEPYDTDELQFTSVPFSSLIHTDPNNSYDPLEQCPRTNDICFQTDPTPPLQPPQMTAPPPATENNVLQQVANNEHSDIIINPTNQPIVFENTPPPMVEPATVVSDKELKASSNIVKKKTNKYPNKFKSTNEEVKGDDEGYETFKIDANVGTDSQLHNKSAEELKGSLEKLSSKLNDVSFTVEDKVIDNNNNSNQNALLTNSATTATVTLAQQQSSAPVSSWAALFNSNASIDKHGGRSQQSHLRKVPEKLTSDASLMTQSPLENSFEQQPFKTANRIKSEVPNRVNEVVNQHLNRLGSFFAKYEIENKTSSVLPRGLLNKSNYCYINAILQALLACSHFYHLIVKIPKMPLTYKHDSKTPVTDAMVELFSHYSTVLERRQQSSRNNKKENVEEIATDAAFEPLSIIRLLCKLRTDKSLMEGRQEDAEEFLSFLLNHLNDEMIELVKHSESNHSKTEKVKKINETFDANANIQCDDTFDDDDGEEWKVISGPKNKGVITRTADFGRSPISDIFGGKLRLRVFREGDHPSDNIEPFFTLKLVAEKASTLQEALDLLVGKDQLEDVVCSRTKKKITAWQQVLIEELPVVLILHLKCFEYKQDSCTKIVKSVEFPIELKIDSKIVASKNKYSANQKQYKLFAVVYHDGISAAKGHYITDAFHYGYNCWIRYDDCSVKSVSEKAVLHPKLPRIPYLLFYQRCDSITFTTGHKRNTERERKTNNFQTHDHRK